MKFIGIRQLALVALALVFAGASTRADTLLGTSTYNYTGASQSYTAPTGTSYIVIKVWGAGGGSGINGTGGGGAFATATYTATGGTSLTVLVVPEPDSRMFPEAGPMVAASARHRDGSPRQGLPLQLYDPR